MSLRILLADDSMTAQKMGVKILTDAGYEVVAVSNGAAATKKIAAEKYDLFVLDVFMPGYSGIEVSDKIRAIANYAKVPILLTVGKMEPFKPEEATKAKADGVIIKPFEASDLLTIVQKLTANAVPVKKTVPPEAEKTVRITPPVDTEADKSMHEWAQTAPEHKDPDATAEFSVSSTPATAAFDAVEAAPAAEFTMPAPDLGAPATEAASSGFGGWEPSPSGPTTFEMPAEPAAPATTMDFAAAEPSSNDFASSLGLGGAAAAAAEIPLEPAAPATFEPVATPAPALESTVEASPSYEPVAAAPGIEYTAAAPVEVPVQQAAELEVQDSGAGIAPGLDPALVTDPTQMMEFATKFGTPEPAPEAVEPQLEVAPEPVAEAAPEPVTEIAPEPVAESVPEPAVEVAPEVQFTPEPVVEAAPAVETAPVAFAEPESTAAAEVTAGPDASATIAQEMEQAVAVAPSVEQPAEPEPPAPLAAEPPTVEASLEQSMQPEPVAEVAPEPVAEPQPAPKGDLEFAHALEAAIADAPIADAEPEAPVAPAPLAAAAAAGATTEAVPAEFDMSKVDPQVVSRAVDRVLGNAKAEIIAEILKELKK